MKLYRVGAIFTGLIMGLSLLVVSVVIAQEGNPEAHASGASRSTNVPKSSGSVAVPSDYQLFAATGAFGGSVAHDAHVISVTSGAAITVFGDIAIWGATYDPGNDRVLFTSPSGGTSSVGNALWQWPFSGGTPTQLGVITSTIGEMRIDGLALVSDTLYGWQQFATDGGDVGLYEIDTSTPPTFVVSLVFTTTDSSIGGIDADPETGKIYGLSDSQDELFEISLTGVVTPVAPYPDASETDIDGLAVGDGRAYLIPDDDDPGLIYVYDFNTMTYTAPISAPWTMIDTFSAGAFRVFEAIAGLTASSDSPTALGNTTTLTATVTAGNAVDYTWFFGDGTSDQGMVVTHTYPAPDTYSVTVVASNPVNTITATTAVTVDEPISGLVASNDSPTVLGDSTTLTAAVATGSQVNYTWLFGDGMSGQGRTVTHTYPATGIYTAVVTASNSVSSATISTTVTIVEPEYHIYLPALFKPAPATTATAVQLMLSDKPLASLRH